MLAYGGITYPNARESDILGVAGILSIAIFIPISSWWNGLDKSIYTLRDRIQL